MDMSNAFRSKSLIYRAVEDNEEDKAFLHSLWLDPQSLHLNNYMPLFRPFNRHASDSSHRASTTNRLISVLICLPVDTLSLEGQEDAFRSDKKVTPIGMLNLHGGMSGDTRHHRTHDIGILIAPEHRGHGYGSEAVRWILNWGFEMAGLHRIGLQSGSFSSGAVRLWKRIGFKQDGVDREALWSNGSWHDEVRFSILEHEWRALVEKEKDRNSGQDCSRWAV
ncbi:acyl-CoA N-acyltransferase [Phaeosphaeriaceae sp. SRC1lsM3a]|nr:acyl-CoA N-acyltransferase [Stagonospora sp. SRC1lsM3a]